MGRRGVPIKSSRVLIPPHKWPRVGTFRARVSPGFVYGQSGTQQFFFLIVYGYRLIRTPKLTHSHNTKLIKEVTNTQLLLLTGTLKTKVRVPKRSEANEPGVLATNLYCVWRSQTGVTYASRRRRQLRDCVPGDQIPKRVDFTV